MYSQYFQQSSDYNIPALKRPFYQTHVHYKKYIKYA